jgi:hypothetical protein
MPATNSPFPPEKTRVAGEGPNSPFPPAQRSAPTRDPIPAHLSSMSTTSAATTASSAVSSSRPTTSCSTSSTSMPSGTGICRAGGRHLGWGVDGAGGACTEPQLPRPAWQGSWGRDSSCHAGRGSCCHPRSDATPAPLLLGRGAGQPTSSRPHHRPPSPAARTHLPPRHELEQRRLAAPVGPRQAVAPARCDGQAGVLQQQLALGADAQVLHLRGWVSGQGTARRTGLLLAAGVWRGLLLNQGGHPGAPRGRVLLQQR